MRKIVGLLVAVAVLAAASSVVAGPSFPDKGWHKGPYITGNVGMMQATNDRHVVTQRKFDGTIIPAFGLTFGWDIADWIGPQLQLSYGTATGQVGTSAAVTSGGTVYPAGTFPLENAREHAINFGLYCRATLPYFTKASWQGDNFKFIPYFKMGGVGHALYVNAPTAANKTGAFGGGIGFGLGAELFIWKGFVIAIDATENIIFQGSYYKNITPAGAAAAVRTKIIEGGTKPQFNLTGMFGWHF